ncbi:dihydroorotate dehydrogenase [Aromatoleum toluvorans]|uniref:Dihydroorotate dehydrogenase n=1 Tax=Aromatoleum toluvorans TaxID=92002 RepID=A0ABX1PVM8_9RHOO|nr:dihydroorotate dehydrogenase [Aromatoleum toluvorans]NMG43488.1 dihydroorotate dehydrogenase [Aromatoleum toluvorans]
MPMGVPPLTPRALRTRWAVARLERIARRTDDGGDAVGPFGPVSAMGLRFASPVGLAAGFDRRGRLLGDAQRLGLGAVEIGTLARADGCPVLPRRAAGGVRCGVSIGRPRHVGWDDAEHACLRVLRAAHAGADYVTLNPGRDCPSPARFADLAGAAVQLRDRLARHRRRPLPLVAKLPSRWFDGDAASLIAVADVFVAAGVDGLLVSTEGHDARRNACATLRVLSAAIDPRVCLISVGGIDSLDEAEARLAAGATLVQVHRALLAHDSWLLRALRRHAPGR